MSDESALLVRMEASLAKFERQMQGGVAAAERSSKMIEGRFAQMGKKMSGSAETSATAIGREMDALRTKYDPLFAASKRYEGELEQLNRAHKVGAIDAKTHGAALAQLNREFAAGSGASDGAATGLGRFTQMSGAARSAVQNTSYQIADMAVQFEMGTDPMRIMAQQLPQIAGGFAGLGGSLGAVLPILGGVLAVGLPIAAMMFSNGEATEDFAEKADRLSEAINNLNAATDAILLDTTAMAEKYGTATSAAREFLSALRDIAEEKARGEATGTADSLSGQFGGFDQTEQFIEGYSVGSELEGTIYTIRDALGVTEEQAASLAAALEALGATQGPEEVVAAAARVTAELEASLGSYGDMNAEAQALYENVSRVGDKASELSGTIDRGTSSVSEMMAAASGLVGRFAAADGAASGLANTLAAAAANAWSLAQGQAAAQNYVNNAKMIQGYQLNARTRGAAPDVAPTAPVVRSSGGGGGGRKGGGGGGGSGKAQEPFFADVEGDIRKLEQQIELLGKTERQAAALKAEWAMMEEAKKRGLDVDKAMAGSTKTLREEIEAQAAAVADLTMALDLQKESQARFEKGIDGISDAMAQALINGGSLREGLAGVFKGIALDLAKSGIRQGLMSLVGGQGGGGGFLSGLFGGFSGGAVPSFDGGGWTGGGARSGGLDGKGGFPAMLHPREMVVDTTKGQSVGGGLIELRVQSDPSVIVEITRNETGRQIKTAMTQVPAIVANHQRRKS